MNDPVETMSDSSLPSIDTDPSTTFFIADIFDALPAKCDRHTLEHPFFTLSMKKDLRTIRYEKDGVSIVVSPSHEYGLPTMYDKDILLYCGSLLVNEINKGNLQPPRKLRFSCHDLLVTTNRTINGQAYINLKESFERLKGVSVTTNIKTNNIKMAAGFGLIESWNVVEQSHDKSRMVKIEVMLSEWFYNALIGKEVLTIHRDYFNLRKPLERRLYEIARKHCGRQRSWKISVENLHKKTGSMSTLKKFRFQLKEIIEIHQVRPHFPEYIFNVCSKDMVVFSFTGPLPDGSLPLSVLDGNTRILSRIRLTTIDRAREMVRESGTGWDYHVLVEQFCDFVRIKGEPTSYNGAFLAFLRKKVKTAP